MDIEMQRQREAQGNIKLDRDDKTGQIRADRESTRGLKHGTEKWIRKQSRIKSVAGYENKHAEGKRGMMPKRGGETRDNDAAKKDRKMACLSIIKHKTFTNLE